MYTEKAIEILDFTEKKGPIPKFSLYANGGQIELRAGDRYDAVLNSTIPGRVLHDRGELEERPGGWQRSMRLLDIIHGFEEAVLRLAREIESEEVG